MFKHMFKQIKNIIIKEWKSGVIGKVHAAILSSATALVVSWFCVMVGVLVSKLVSAPLITSLPTLAVILVCYAFYLLITRSIDDQ